MFDMLRDGLIQWNQRTTDMQKLQQSYVVLLVLVVFLAGVVSLFNTGGLTQLIFVATALLIALGVNFVIWALMKAALLDKIPRQARRTTRRTSRKS